MSELKKHDLLSAEVAADPYPYYARLRSEDPVHWHEAGHVWLLTRYQDVLDALRDPRLSAKWIQSFMGEMAGDVRRKYQPLERHLSQWLLLSDPPEHTRRRGPANRAFEKNVVEGLRSRIQTIVDGLLDKVEARGRMDLIGDFAYPLPTIVVAGMMGVPAEDHDRFKAWSDDILAFIATDQPLAERAEQAQKSLLEQTEYLADIFARRKAEPRSDLISILVHSEEHGYELSDEERASICVQTLLDGHETTTNLLGNAILALHDFPDQLPRLQGDPSLIPAAVEEFLRYDGPVQLAVRVAAEDLELGGRQIRRGQLVWPMLGAANRDPEKFPDPDRLDFDRPENPHLAFGYGTHFCIGSPVARLESQIALETLLRRFPDLRLDVGREALEWIGDPMLHGVTSLPLAF